MDEQHEKMTWTWMDDRREGDVGVNRYYLPNLPTPDGRSSDTTAEPVPPSAAAAGAGIGVCLCVGVAVPV
jgi:hypothetical protein